MRITGSTCLRCLRNFATRTRLLRHVLYRSKICASYYNQSVPIVDVESFKIAEQDTANDDKVLRKNGFSIYHSETPSVVLSGPKGFLRDLPDP